MTDLNLQPEYTYNNKLAKHAGYSANPASLKVNLNTPEVKDHFKKNTVGSLIENTSEAKKDKFAFLKQVLYGASVVFPLTWVTDKLFDAESYDKTPFKKVVKKLDHISENNLKGFNGISGTLKKTAGKISQIPIIKDFAKVSDSVKPVWGMARSNIVNTEQHYINELLMHSEEIADKTVLPTINKIKTQVDARGITHRQAYEQVSKLFDGTKNKQFKILSNKVQALIKTENNTLLGKAFKKGVTTVSKVVHPGSIGGMGLMMLPLHLQFAGETLYKTANAPKEDKLSTFMESFLGEFMAMWVLIEATTRKTYQLASLKNLPKGKGIGELIRKPLRLAGKALAIGTDNNLSHLMSDGAAKKMFGEGTEGLAKFMQAKSLAKAGADPTAWKPIMNEAKKCISPAKRALVKATNIGGGVGRLLFTMLVLMPFVEKLFKGASHKIFGKPKATIMEELKEKQEKEKAKLEEQKATETYSVQPNTIPTTEKAQKTNYVKASSSIPMVQKYLELKTHGNATVSAASGLKHQETNKTSDSAIPSIESYFSNSPDNNSSVSALGLFKNKEEKYIPSSDAAEIDSEGDQKLLKELLYTDEILKKADKKVKVKAKTKNKEEEKSKKWFPF